MNWYARSALAMLLGSFGLIAIGVGLDGLFGPFRDTGPYGPGKRLPEYLPPSAVLVTGVVALGAAWWLSRSGPDEE